MCYKKLSTIFCQRLRRTGSPGGAFAAGSASNQGVEMSEPNQATPPPRTPGPGSGAHCCWESTGTAMSEAGRPESESEHEAAQSQVPGEGPAIPSRESAPPG